MSGEPVARGACRAPVSPPDREKELDRVSELERPSGKGAGDENFPVGSWLLPGRLRRHIASFYAYARAIDDIADDPHLAPQEKTERLERFARAVTERDDADPALQKAHRIRRSLRETGVTPRHCVDLTRAFRQDAIQSRYGGWDDLMAYCNLSAAPVGRYLVDLHGQSAAAYPASDALCNALQVLNHLQDCADDYRALDRVYLPQAWMEETGCGVEDLARGRCTPALRRVIDRCLDATGELLRPARTLPGRLENLRFAMEAAAIVAIAEQLCAELRRRDPLAERVVLSRVQFLQCCARGAARALAERRLPRRRRRDASRRRNAS